MRQSTRREYNLVPISTPRTSLSSKQYQRIAWRFIDLRFCHRANSPSSTDHDRPLPPNTIIIGSNLHTRPHIRIETTFHSNWTPQSPIIPLRLLDACLQEAFGSTLKHRPTDPAVPMTAARHFTGSEPSSPGKHAPVARQVRLQFGVTQTAFPPGLRSAPRAVDYEEFEAWMGLLVRYEQKYIMTEITDMNIIRVEQGERTLVGRAEVRGFL